MSPRHEFHLDAHPGIKELLPEVTSHIVLPKEGEYLSAEIDLKRDLGPISRVSTDVISVNCETQFTFRKERKGPSRVAVVQPTEMVSTVVVKAGTSPMLTGIYFLDTAYVGTDGPMEPWDKKLSQERLQESLDFWCKNALVYDECVMSEIFTSTWEEVLRRYRK